MDFLSSLTESQRPHVDRRPWMDECSLIRVTKENLQECIDACIHAPNGFFSLDLETTGLDNRVVWNNESGRTMDQIVGVCLSPDGKTGYYIPLRHQKTESNVPWTYFDKEFRRLIAAVEQGKVIAVFHNGTFDQEFLEFNGASPYGEWDNPKHWDDTLILIYLENSRRRTKRLKEVVKEDFNVEMLNLSELYTQEERESSNFKPDFSNRDPDRDEVVWYGCGDAIWTYKLREKYHPLIVDPEEGPNQKIIYQIEKLCVPATRWMMRNRIKVNKATVKELIVIGQKEWLASIQEVYQSAAQLLERDIMPGYIKLLIERFVADDINMLLPEQVELARNQAPMYYSDPKGKFKKETEEFSHIYDVLSPQQLGEMFLELKVPGLKFTEKSNQVKTTRDEIDRVIKEAEAQFPFMSKIKRFREILKALSSYLIPMYRHTDPNDDTMRINFNAHKVDTGRFSTPAKENSDDDNVMLGWPQINLQSLPATYDPKRPECMARLRECITGRHRRLIGAWDFSGVELRLVTNFSGEPKWLDAFFKCSNCNRTFSRGDGQSTPEAPPPRCPNCGSDKIGDIHTLTGIEVYGQEAASLPDWKQKRQKAKSLNFAMAYGGGGSAAQRAVGCDKNEGWRIKHKFDGSYKGLTTWWGKQHEFARKNGYILTAFGRKYPLPDINSPDGGFRSKAERNATNGPIQGSSADITKIAMGLIYKEMKKRGWHKDKVLMIITMHDELVFEIAPEILAECCPLIKSIMCRNSLVLAKKWPVPLTSDIEIGYGWDVPWHVDTMQAGEVRYIGNKKIKDEKKAEEMGYKWSDLPFFPEALLTVFQGKEDKIDQTVSIPEVKQMHSPPPLPEEIPKLAPNDVYVFKLGVVKSLGSIENLAKTITVCKNKGSKELKILTREGTSLENWTDEPIYVHEAEFYFTAKNNGLC